jgi:hypothetical protein
VKLHVGSRPGRIGLTVQQPGTPVPTSPEFDGQESQPQADGKRDEFLRHAMGFLGTPWKAGSHDPKAGLDGASLVDICLKRVGLLQDDEQWPDGPALAMQYQVIGGDKAEPPGDILPGDLAFFGSGDHDQDSMQHPFIWLGGGRVLGPLPDHGSSNGAVKIAHVAEVPDHFAGWSHIDDLGKKTDHTAHPGDAPAGTRISGALLPAEPADRYDYLKHVVAAAGGKWNDEKGKVNLVGVQELHERCLISPRSAEWNDTLFVNYVDQDGHKCSLDLRASLNPGYDPDPAGSWQLVDGGFTFKLDKGDGVEKALVPEGKVKGWFDQHGLGALRPGDSPHGGRKESPRKEETPDGPEPEHPSFDDVEVSFLSIRVVDAGDDDKPLASVSYKVVGEKEYSGKTDDTGLVHHAGVPLENYELQIQGYDPVHVPAFLDANDLFVARVRKG